MIRYSELPPYANRDFLDKEQILQLEEEIKIYNEKLIYPILRSGKPAFKIKIDVDFQYAKKMAERDLISLVSYFLTCMFHLSRHGSPYAKFLVEWLMGQQDGITSAVDKSSLIDGINYGHLKKLQEILYEYTYSHDSYYLNMMQLLTSPYKDVMNKVIIMCQSLFKASDGSDIDLIGNQKNVEYLFD